MAETLHEIAEREAEEAELADADAEDETTTGDAPEPETPDVPEPEQAALTPEQMERALAKLDKEATRHANEVSKIMGEDAAILVPCELCAPSLPGFRFPEPPDDETTARVLVALGIGNPDAQAVDPDAQPCDVCRGHGVLRTGSLVPSQMTRPCPKCGANGWTTPDMRRQWDSMEQGRKAAAAYTDTTATPQAPPEALNPNDAFGRPFGHPCYGLMPQYMTAEQRALDLPGIHG